MTVLDNLKTIKNGGHRNVKFWLEKCDDNMSTTLSDGSIALKNELVDLLLDTAIKYMEKEKRK